MNRSRRIPILLALAALSVAGGIGAWAYAQTCDTSAAYRLYAGSYMDSMLNPPKAEDVDFFTQSSGPPNIMLLLDNSASMNRLPPNGPGFLGGTVPPSGAAAAGCGLTDPSLVAAGTMLSAVASRVYSSPCGAAVDAGVVGAPFDSTKDYAAEASVCPYWSQGSNAVATGASGYDPDWYKQSDAAGTSTKSSGNNANLFPKNLVFHDAIVDTSVPAIADGWSFGSANGTLNPYQVGNSAATVDQFCTDLQSKGTISSKDVCNACLQQKGWFYDGRLLSATMDNTSVSAFPSIWYTGAYLNFFPPKFLIARKVLKDTVMNFSKVRAAIATFTSASGGGANIIQGMSPTCTQPDSQWNSNRSTYIKALDGIAFTGGTPLAKALLDVGKYYHSPQLDWWNSTWRSGDSSIAGSGTPEQYSICYSCQVSSVILITDGVPKQSDDGCGSTANDNLPQGALTTLAMAQGGTYAGSTTTSIQPTCPVTASSQGGVSTVDCPECGYFDAAHDWLNNTTWVAWYLHNFDLRDNNTKLESTKDCLGNGGRQTLDVYTLGFNNSGNYGADQLLANAAKVGGGISVSASNASEMRNALSQIQQIINTRATSFSVATLSTLQSQAGHSTIVPRFSPAKGPFWPGHLFRFELYSEFVNDCTPNGVGDLDCDGTCTGVFLQDAEGNFIQEDGTGSFKVNVPNKPSCAESKCGDCGDVGGADAIPWWDSGTLLRDRSWKQRFVYTAVDSSGDGRLDAKDATFQLVTTDDDLIDKLIPYLNLVGTPVCTQLAANIGLAGDPTTATAIRSDTTLRLCAKEIVRYTLGADVLNEMNRSGSDYPPRSASGAIDRDLLKDRAWKLGDIFHSSPVVVDPPSPSDGLLCPRGLSRQCIPSLWNTPVQQDSYGTSGNAYDGYAKSDAYRTRRKLVLVGANDGMLHAFNGGQWLANKDDTLTTGIDESQPPFNGYYDRSDSGDELWAFVPPDQLAKLHLLMGTSHYLFVDGTPMVRDVWVDGTGNGLAAATAADDVKQKQEFHTVAVMGERRGGVHHFALDITDAFQADGTAPPTFLWLYPQPTDKRLLWAGEGYSDFLPTPPPIGPVRIEADSVSGAARPNVTPVTTDSTGASVPYHERWVAFLSGGFDPQYLRGRGVHMVDVWTGSEIFDFSFPYDGSVSCAASATDPRCALRYPVPATVAMVQWGQNLTNTASFANDGYFDTATFGDAGGQMWVLRFNDPAKLDAGTKLATNWFGGRLFQMGGIGAPLLCANEPFFYITANVSLSVTGSLRVLAGTGDRYNLLDPYGGTCGPDNIRACIQRGCTVTEAASSNGITVPGLGSRQSALAASSCSAFSASSDSLATATACPIVGKTDVAIVCGSGNSAPRTTKDVQFTCSSGTGGAGCAPTAGTTPSTGSPLALNDSSNVLLTYLNKYYALSAFGPVDGLTTARNAKRILFTTAQQATDYDAARLTDSDLVSIDGADSNTSPTQLATSTSAGWALVFNHAPTVTITGIDYTVTRPDERVSSTSALAANCTYWNTSQPVVATATTAGGNCAVSNCKQVNRRVHYMYGADVTTGGTCGLVDPSTLLPIRSTKAVALVPPPAPQYTVFINQKGQVQVGMTSVNTEIGARNVSQGSPVDPANVLEFLDVPRSLHDCRHSSATGTGPTNCR